MYRNVVTEMSQDWNGSDRKARSNRPDWKVLFCVTSQLLWLKKLQMVSTCAVIRTFGLLH